LHSLHHVIITHCPVHSPCFGLFKGIVSWDFDGIFMILSYSLDVRQAPHHILF
jgi:hypothetical protein